MTFFAKQIKYKQPTGLELELKHISLELNELVTLLCVGTG